MRTGFQLVRKTYNVIMHFRALLVLVLAFGAVQAKENQPYLGHRLISVEATTQEQLEALVRLEEDADLLLDFWAGPSRQITTQIRVPPQYLGETMRRLRMVGLSPKIQNHNLQDVVDEDRARIEEARAMAKSRNNEPSYLNMYLTYDEVRDYLYTLPAKHSDTANIEINVYGKTYEGRDLLGVKITSKSGDQKPDIWIEAGTHAREWITISTALYFIDSLASDADLLDKYNWYIMPIHNPDGYAYTWKRDRYWRKNREPNQSSRCVGTDLNRNWDINHKGTGASPDPCSDTYHGQTAMSTAEVYALAAAASASSNIAAFFSIHCFSQLILVPNGYTEDKPINYNLLAGIAQEAADTLENAYGSMYRVGTPPDILYVASGGAYDYFFSVLGAKYSYTYELRPSSGGYLGFVLDEKQIPATVHETWLSLVSFANQIAAIEGH